jgi:hypothetical protein
MKVVPSNEQRGEEGKCEGLGSAPALMFIDGAAKGGDSTTRASQLGFGFRVGPASDSIVSSQLRSPKPHRTSQPTGPSFPAP